MDENGNVRNEIQQREGDPKTTEVADVMESKVDNVLL
jgi:hypothetical protein